MKIWNVLKSRLVSKSYRAIEKQNKILMDGLLRPVSRKGYFSQSPFLYPTFPYDRFFLYDLSYSSDTLTTIHNALRRELFRNGFELAKAKDTQEEQPTSEEETIPKGKTTEEILKFLEKINENQQCLLDVCMETEDDFSIMDNAFWVFMFEYIFKENGSLKSRELKQLLRADPRFMGPILNKYDRPAYNDDDVPLYFCPEHRETLLEGIDTCQCGKKCWQAFFFKFYEGKKVFYSRWEVLFRSKYRPTIRGGFPPVLSVWQKTRTLLFMDKYIMQMYDGQRPPKHGLFFKTANADSLYKTLDEAKQKIRDDPHWPLMLAIPDTTNGQDFVKFIDFMKSLDELQHVEMRNEFRRQMGSVYGVEPVFQGDMSTSGGLNNEGLQVTVTNRAAQYGQNIYNNHFFPELLKAMGVQGFTLKLNPSEEQDEMAKLTRQNQSLFNGQIAIKLGLKAKYDKDTGEVIIEDGDLEEQEVTQPESPFGTPSTPPRPTGSPSIGKSWDFNKELIKARSRPPFTRFSNIIKREIDKFIKKFKRKPSEAELSKAIGKINLELIKELKDKTSSLFKRAYIDEIGKVEGELGVNVLFGTIDENALAVLNNQEVLSKAYTGIASNLTTELNGIIQEAYRDPKGLTSKQITDKIKDLTDVADFHAETIARTESSKVSSAARKNSYAKEEGFDTFLFKWIGPDDNRTTETSKRIKKRAREGVSWSELIKIVEEESSIDFPEWTVNKEFPVSHYNSRHTFIKIPGSVVKKEELIKREEMQKEADINLTDKEKEIDSEMLDNLMRKQQVNLIKEKQDVIKKIKKDMNGK